MGPGSSFLTGNDAADELARRGSLLMLSAITCSLSSLIFRIHSFFSRTGGLLSHRSSLTHKFPRFPSRSLCSLVTLPVFSLVFVSFYLKLCGRSSRNCLLSPSVLSGYNRSPDTRFSRGTMRLMSWPDREHYLHPLQSLVVSFLLFFVSTIPFSRTGGVLSHRSSLTHRFPRSPPRNLCSLVMLAAFSLVYAATDTVFC